MKRVPAAVIALTLFAGAARGGDIVLVTIDTWRADHVGYAGSAVQTPTLDSLATAGCVFEQAITAVPLTLPAHCTILTGLYPHHHGVRVNEHYLGPDAPTLAELMQKKGFTTAAFVGAFPLAAQFGLRRGFDYYDDRFERPDEVKLPMEHRFRHERRASEVVDATLGWLDQAKPRRLFLWVHVYDPHDPYEAPTPWRAGYEGEIEYTDRELGRLLRELRERRRDIDLLVVTGDHGEGLGEHEEPNHGLFIYDTTIRVPLVMAGAGIPRGTRRSAQVGSVDLLPTIAEFAGIAPPTVQDGASLAPLARGKPPVAPTRPEYIESLYALGLGWAPLRGVRTDEWKYIEAPDPELYHLLDDSKEVNNVHAGEPRRAALQADALSKLRSGEIAPGGHVSEEQMERLRSLGYLSGGGAGGKSTGTDPKKMAGFANRLGHANGLFTFGKLDEAIVAFDALRKEDPANPFVLLRLGTLHQRSGHAEPAIAAFRAARAADPSSSEICYQLGETFLRAGKPDSASVWYRRSLDITPGRTAALANIGACRFQQGNYAEARQLLSEAAIRSPEDGRVLGNLGAAELMLGNLDAAHDRFRESEAVLGEGFTYHYELGVVLLRRKEVEPALEQFAATQGPRRPDALIELAAAATARSQAPRAVELLEEALKLGGDRIRQRIAIDPRLQALRGTTDGARIFGGK